MATTKNEEAATTKTAPPVKSSGATVAVMCCLPHGVQFALSDGRKVVIAGNAAPLRGLEKGVLPNGGFGGVITMIAEDDWNQIKTIYSGMAIFENGLIFAAKDKGRALDEAAEKKEVKNGREPVDPKATNTEPAKVAEV